MSILERRRREDQQWPAALANVTMVAHANRLKLFQISKLRMTISVTISSMFLILVLTTTSCSSLPLGVDNCKPSLLPRLPPRMKNICISLLQTIQQFEDQLESLQPAQGKASKAKLNQLYPTERPPESTVQEL